MEVVEAMSDSDYRTDENGHIQDIYGEVMSDEQWEIRERMEHGRNRSELAQEPRQ